MSIPPSDHPTLLPPCVQFHSTSVPSSSCSRIGSSVPFSVIPYICVGYIYLFSLFSDLPLQWTSSSVIQGKCRPYFYSLKERKGKSLSHGRLLLVHPWTAASLCSVHGDFPAEEYWKWLPLPSPIWSSHQDWTQASHTVGRAIVWAKLWFLLAAEKHAYEYSRKGQHYLPTQRCSWHSLIPGVWKVPESEMQHTPALLPRELTDRGAWWAVNLGGKG